MNEKTREEKMRLADEAVSKMINTIDHVTGNEESIMERAARELEEQRAELDKPNITACIMFSDKDSRFMPECIESVKRLGIPMVIQRNIPVPKDGVPNRSVLARTDGNDKFVEFYYEKNGNNDFDFLTNRFSFSQARNECKKYAETDWILSLDADERICIEKSEIDMLATLPENIKGVTVALKNFVAQNEIPHSGYEAGVHHVCRIFRSNCGWDWYSRCHEQIIPNNVGYDAIVNSSIMIKHIGYQNPKSEAVKLKYVRNIGMMCFDLANADFSSLKRNEIALLKNMTESIAHLFKFKDFAPDKVELLNLETLKANIDYMNIYGVNLSFDLNGVVSLIKSTCAGLVRNPFNRVLLVEAFKSINLFNQLYTELNNGK